LEGEKRNGIGTQVKFSCGRDRMEGEGGHHREIKGEDHLQERRKPPRFGEAKRGRARHLLA